MTWGPYYFFYECPECGKKFRWCLDDMNESSFSQCPACHTEGHLIGETKELVQGDARFVDYEDV